MKATTLEIEFELWNQKNIIYPVIIQDQNEMILIDCGYPGFFPLIQKAASKKGIDLKHLTKVIITHHDYDHIGALANIKHEIPNIVIYSSKDEADYINGLEKSLRLQQAQKIYDTLPEEEKKGAKEFEAYLESVEHVKVDCILPDKDYSPWDNDLEIVATPGHTKGHLSLYLKEEKTLIAGDAIVIEDGTLKIPFPQYSYDLEQAKSSIKKLLKYEINTIICYHGGIYTQNIKSALEDICKENTSI